MSRISYKVSVSSSGSLVASEILAQRSGLSRGRIKDAMNKGAVWITRKKHGRERLRRATAPVRAGDTLELYYDDELLALKPPQSRCLSDRQHYSVWYKPPGLLTQGTNYGDHCALTRQAELFFNPRRKVFLVHRIDREASGLVVLAHSSEAASKLSMLFQNNQVEKHYRIEVLGDLAGEHRHGTIDLPLDGKSALTIFEATSYDAPTNTSRVEVVIRTGRLHQIRRHFNGIGFPVMGDPRYGRGNKNSQGMRLAAYSLGFQCPFEHERVVFTMEDGNLSEEDLSKVNGRGNSDG